MTTNNEIPPRWYMLTKDGVATLCVDEADAIKTAAEADFAWPNNAPHVAVQLAPVRPAMPADADLNLEDQRLALWQAIQGIKIGNAWDDKLIVANLHAAGFCIAHARRIEGDGE